MTVLDECGTSQNQQHTAKQPTKTSSLVTRAWLQASLHRLALQISYCFKNLATWNVEFCVL